MSFEQLVATLIHLPYRFLVRESEKLRKNIMDIPIDDLGVSQIHFDSEEVDIKMREGSIVEF